MNKLFATLVCAILCMSAVQAQNEKYVSSKKERQIAAISIYTAHGYIPELKQELALILREQVNISNVTFEPRCRNNWHIHRATKGGGQMLVGVAGRGWYQEEGKPAQQILSGTVIHIPAGVKHWHGATADSWFAHLAFGIHGENTSNEWFEPRDERRVRQARQQ